MEDPATPRTTQAQPIPAQGSNRGRTPRPWTVQLAWFFGVLLAVIAASVAVVRPTVGEVPSDLLFLGVMYAPTCGALAAWAAAGGRIQWGRINWWVLAALLPVVVALLFYLAAAAVGLVELVPGALPAALAAAPVAIAVSCISAFGEEVGWRGFLWPLLRGRYGFWRTSAFVGAVWWFYHVPLVLLGWYGSVAGLVAFTVALVGFVLFVGVLTDRSRAVWPSVVAHGGWNALVAVSFPAHIDGYDGPSFTGSPVWLGEFGWLAAVAMLVLGFAAAAWHVRRSAGPA